MPTFRKLPTGGVRAIVRIKPHPAITKTFDLMRDAKAWAMAEESRLRFGARPVAAAASERTVKAMVDAYLLNGTEHLSPSTIGPVTRSLRWLADQAGHRRVADLIPDDMRALRKLFMSEPAARRGTDPTKAKPRGPATADNWLAYCRVAFSEAIKWGWITYNPAGQIEKLNRNAGKTDVVRRSLTVAQRKRLMQEVAEHEALRDAVALYLATGARQMDIMTLTAGDVILEARAEAIVLSIDKADGLQHVVPIADTKVLAMLRRRVKGKQARELLFPGSVVDKQGNPKPVDLRRPWEAALSRAGIELPAGTSWHALRHTAAVHVLRNGASLPEVGALLGHRTPQATAVYAQVHPEHLRKVAGLMAKASR